MGKHGKYVKHHRDEWEKIPAFKSCQAANVIQNSELFEVHMDKQVKSNHPPRTVTSRRNIKYRESGWRVHEFEVWSGEMICRAAVLGMQGSLLVWLGNGGEPRLSQAALGMPAVPGRAEGCAAALLGAGGEPGAKALAQRLATALAQPVYVCYGAEFDRFTLPLVERGLVAEIKNRPDCF